MQLRRITPLLIIVGTFLSIGCAVRSSEFYSKTVQSGKLKPGMSQDEVKAILGEPTGFHRRQISPNELRELWVYHVEEPDLRERHLFPSIHLIVFSNGKFVAVDPLDPMAPHLVASQGRETQPPQ
ncbi:MAG: hypothetical protein ACE5HN_10805 [Nitrospiria bacterium]